MHTRSLRCRNTLKLWNIFLYSFPSIAVVTFFYSIKLLTFILSTWCRCNVGRLEMKIASKKSWKKLHEEKKKTFKQFIAENLLPFFFFFLARLFPLKLNVTEHRKCLFILFSLTCLHTIGSLCGTSEQISIEASF